jgi:membrane associated rhomboid family serine protease
VTRLDSASPDPSGDPAARFGTEAFYAAIGRAFVAMCAIVPVLFLIEVIDSQLLGNRLDHMYGIAPHELSGLDGVVFAPFLHVNFPHLVGNSVPLILMGTFVLAAGTRRFIVSTVIIMLVSGLGVWFTGRAGTFVVGASGVIFGYLGVLFARGLVERSWWNLAVGALIAMLYGWQLIGVLPTDQRISWQAHLFGFIGGVAAAIVVRRRGPRRVRADKPRRPLRVKLQRSPAEHTDNATVEA